MSSTDTPNATKSRRQIVFDWLMADEGYWGTSEEVAMVDALLAALDSATVSANVPASEPVAWRYKLKGTHSMAWKLTDEKPTEAYEAQPLYLAQSASATRTCRMQDGPPIPWALAEAIWKGYAKLGGDDQPLEVVDRRGGFGWDEVAYIWKHPEARRAIEAALHTADRGVKPGYMGDINGPGCDPDVP